MYLFLHPIKYSGTKIEKDPIKYSSTKIEIYFNNVLNMMSEYIKTNYYNQNVLSTITKKTKNKQTNKKVKIKTIQLVNNETEE